jgi:hypothetical protein
MTENDDDVLVPDRKVREELGGKSIMTLWRWDNIPGRAPEGWEPPLKMGNRNHRTKWMLKRVRGHMARKAQEHAQERAQKRAQVEAGA